MNTPMIITCFDFDGTLRDGLAEKIFAYQMAIDVTGRLLGFKTDIPFTERTMRSFAGFAAGDIATAHWSCIYEDGRISKSEFQRTFEAVWQDVYAQFNLSVRDPHSEGPVIDFTDEEKNKIISYMPEAEWFEGTQAMMEDLCHRKILTGILSNTPNLKSLTDEVTAGVVPEDVEDIFTGSVVGLGKPNAYSLLYFVASAFNKQHAPDQQEVLQRAVIRGDQVDFVIAVDGALASLAKTRQPVSLLMVGDGHPDIEVAHNARDILGQKFPELVISPKPLITIESMAVTYGFMSQAQLEPTNPDHWAASPQLMIENVNRWIESKSSPVLTQDLRGGALERQLHRLHL